MAASSGASTRVTYVPNLPMIEAAAQMYGGMGVAIATPQIEEAARAIAPVRTGAFQDSIQSEVIGTHGRVWSDIRYAAYLEFGTSDTPTFATLRRATDAVHI